MALSVAAGPLKEERETGQPSSAWEHTAVKPGVNESPLPRILSYPTVGALLSRKTPLFATLLSSHKAQYFSFPDSFLLISLLSYGTNPSVQPEGDLLRSETK